MEKVKFKNLEELYLSGNQISDIKVFENTKFEKLKILNLTCNTINKNNYSSLINNLTKKINFDI